MTGEEQAVVAFDGRERVAALGLWGKVELENRRKGDPEKAILAAHLLDWQGLYRVNIHPQIKLDNY